VVGWRLGIRGLRANELHAHLGVDVGGTFTDAALVSAEGVITAKVPTTPGHEADGVAAAVAETLEKASIAPRAISSFTHGMTIGTNALLSERGARTALVTTSGFADVIEIGRQARPSLYRPCAHPPRPLVPPDLRFEVAERVGPGGILEPLADSECDRVAQRVAGTRPEAVAVCLLFSYEFPEHEQRIADAIRTALPGVPVIASHQVAAVFREFERTSTTVIDAYLAPLLGNYLGALSATCERAGLPSPHVMLSSGGTAPAEERLRSGAWSVLSGPAGGAVGAGAVARALGLESAVAFDMGGTSCDVSIVRSSGVGLTDRHEVAGRPIQLPMVDVLTIGSGGGSISWIDQGGVLRVGPESAGARPGPACYGNGGQNPTVTDACLVLGYISPDTRLAGGIRPDLDAANDAFGPLAEALDSTIEQIAEGTCAIACQQMAGAMRLMTVERGVDPRDHALLPFGGAGGMFAAALATELGMDRVVCPPGGGVLSALGLAVAGQRRDRARTVMLAEGGLTTEVLEAEIASLTASALADLEASPGEVAVAGHFDVRYAGQAFELTVAAPSPPSTEAIRAAFEAEHERRYGYRDTEAEIEIVTVRVAASTPQTPLPASSPATNPATERHRELRFDGRTADAVVLATDSVAGFAQEGPAVIEMAETTIVVPPGWLAGDIGAGGVELKRAAEGDSA